MQVAAVVKDAAQERQIQAGLEEAGIVLALPIVNLSSTGWSEAEAIVDLQVRAWAQKLETWVIGTLAELRGLARWLRIPEVSIRSWEKWVDRITTGVAA